MRVSKRASVVAVTTAVALVAAGCSGGDDSDTNEASGDTANGAITIDGTQPEVGLVPANTTETGGGKIIDFMWTGLVQYPNDGSDPVNAVAESINTTDSKVYTIKIKPNTKFHDGTVVRAKNFVDAWNWAAYSPNGAQNGSFFSDIQGFTDVHTEDPDGEGPKEAPEPTVKEMSGLKVVDDTTFEVTLASPFSIFPVKLGYSAFMPLPDAFFTQTPEVFGKKPIGNGPVKFVSWQDNVEVKLTRFDDYTLDDKVKIKDVTIRMYQEDTAAYNDLVSGTLDFQQQIPVSALAGDKWKADLGERAIEAQIPVKQIISFPLYDKRFQDANLRKAISMSINRAEIADKIFFGTRAPANSWSSPLAPGHVANDCTVCKFDPAAAKAALEQSGGFTGEMVIYYNSDGPHKEWMEAVAQQIKTNLGINARAEGVPTFAVFRETINARKAKGPYRAGWQQDFPTVENWLGPLYVTGASSNDGLFSNAEVDRLYKEGAAAATVDAANAKFAEALKVVDSQVPAMPMLDVEQQSGVSDRVTGVKVTNVGEIDLSSVEIK
ncbi:MAG TPA: ABC transporter substrate-binding protein [Actinoplanes sp.]|nr:ABC transporter substrate-binding protein [Actinoplanes sp.]